MIERHELRLNNSISSTYHNGLITEINSLFPDSLRLWANPLANYKYSDIEPIPLTAEILTKLGFEVIDDNPKKKPHYEGDILFKICDFEFTNSQIDGFRCYEINGGNTIYKYVHQLQNLYQDLTGNVLDVNLTQKA